MSLLDLFTNNNIVHDYIYENEELVPSIIELTRKDILNNNSGTEKSFILKAQLAIIDTIKAKLKKPSDVIIDYKPFIDSYSNWATELEILEVLTQKTLEQFDDYMFVYTLSSSKQFDAINYRVIKKEFGYNLDAFYASFCYIPEDADFVKTIKEFKQFPTIKEIYSALLAELKNCCNFNLYYILFSICDFYDNKMIVKNLGSKVSDYDFLCMNSHGFLDVDTYENFLMSELNENFRSISDRCFDLLCKSKRLKHKFNFSGNLIDVHRLMRSYNELQRKLLNYNKEPETKTYKFFEHIK